MRLFLPVFFFRFCLLVHLFLFFFSFFHMFNSNSWILSDFFWLFVHFLLYSIPVCIKQLMRLGFFDGLYSSGIFSFENQFQWRNSSNQHLSVKHAISIGIAICCERLGKFIRLLILFSLPFLQKPFRSHFRNRMKVRKISSRKKQQQQQNISAV